MRQFHGIQYRGERFQKQLWVRTTRSRSPRIRRHRPRASKRTELATLVHRGERLAHVEQHLDALVRGLINARVRDLDTEAAQAEDVRDDVAPGELASCRLLIPRPGMMV